MTPQNRLSESERMSFRYLMPPLIVCAGLVMSLFGLSLAQAQTTSAARDGAKREPSVSATKSQTQRHLMALQSITATEQVGLYSYQVALYGNRLSAVRPPTPHGPTIKDAWYVLLRDSQVWKWLPTADHYEYVDTCGWAERGVQLVPCKGEIYVDGKDVTRITQRLQTERWGIVVLDLHFGWEQLSERRLVPKRLTLEWGGGTITATWTSYHEWRSGEPVVAEAEADDSDLQQPTAPIKEGAEANRSLYTPLPAVKDDTSEVNARNPPRQGDTARDSEGRLGDSDGSHRLLTPPQGTPATVAVRRRWWHRLLIKRSS